MHNHHVKLNSKLTSLSFTQSCAVEHVEKKSKYLHFAIKVRFISEIVFVNNQGRHCKGSSKCRSLHYRIKLEHSPSPWSKSPGNITHICTLEMYASDINMATEDSTNGGTDYHRSEGIWPFQWQANAELSGIAFHAVLDSLKRLTLYSSHIYRRSAKPCPHWGHILIIESLLSVSFCMNINPFIISTVKRKWYFIT